MSPQDPTQATRSTTRRAVATKLPKMGRHSSGQARITLSGRVHYLGPWDTPEAHANYATRIREWIQNGRRDIQPPATPPQAMLTLSDVVHAYIKWIGDNGLYRKNGKSTTTMSAIRCALESLCDFAGTRRVAMPLESMAKSDRDSMLTIVDNWRDVLLRNPTLTRKGINVKVGLVKQFFRWARRKRLVTPELALEVRDLEPLQRSRVGNRPESGRKRRPVTMDEVELVAKACESPQVAAMLRLQSMTAMRPGEVRNLRWSQIDKQPEGAAPGYWMAVIEDGKTAGHGVVLRYVIPPAGVAILSQFLYPGADFVFSPARCNAQRRQQRGTDGTPLRRTLNDHWSQIAYYKATVRACKLAGVQWFCPHEIRHGAITWCAKQFGLVVAQAMANHTAAVTTARYIHATQRDRFTVAEAMERKVSG